MAVKNFVRLLLVMLRARVQPRRAVGGISRIRMRVMPNDLDVFGHMNNGTFLTLQDLGRIDWLIRTGLHERFTEMRISPVVAAQTIAYRASLNPGERFLIETRYLGSDDYSFFLEQRFTVDGQVRSQSFVRGRYVGADGPVTVRQVLDAVPEVSELADLVPDWVREWSEHTRLPSRRTETPSVWHRDRGGLDVTGASDDADGGR